MTTSGLLQNFAQALLTGQLKIIDLSQPLGARTPVLTLPAPFANTPPVEEFTISHFDDAGPYWKWKYYTIGEHTGTHFDAPGHWITGKGYPNGATDTIEPERMIAPACVVDCSAEAAADPDFCLTAERIMQFEASHGSIAGSWVLMRTDWSRKNGDPQAFLGASDTGPHTPGPSVDAVKYMVENDAIGFGVETVGTDAGQAFSFEVPYPAHTLMHGANRFGLASLANLDKLPARGAILVTTPLKFTEGSGSPVRALAIVEAA